MFYPPNIDWNNKNLIDPRGIYLLCKNYKKENYENITTSIFSQYQAKIFESIENKQKDKESFFYKKNLRTIQIHNEFLFYVKKNIKCTNSYIKMWEILSWMKSNNLLQYQDKYEQSSDVYKIFFDAEFPGNFIKSAIHFFSTTNTKIDWLASSLIPCDENTALEDIYGFYKNYPNKWLMNNAINGDVTNIETFNYHYKNVMDYTNNEGMDMYICDLGLQHDSSNFYQQEINNILPQTCAILKGLSILKKNGILICKIFSCLEKTTRDLIIFLNLHFDRIYICKPSSSRGRNKELYIILLGYKKILSFNKLQEYFISKNLSYELENLQNYNEEYENLEYISNFFISRQMSWLYKMQSEFLEKEYHDYAEKYVEFLDLN